MGKTFHPTDIKCCQVVESKPDYDKNLKCTSAVEEIEKGINLEICK